VKFRANTDGYICGLRFYKGAGNSGTHVGKLWSSTGTLLTSATFSNETATGWQQVDFPAPVPIQANTLYVASYLAPVGGYAGDTGYFATSGVTNGPLYALSDGESGGNGVYLYGSGGFPSNTYQSTNYWVDVVFTTSTGPDTTAPTVSMTAPPSGATVSGTTVAVSADASDNVGVVSVQFLLDGAALGAPVTSAPYAITLDSTTAANGTHTLEARAVDAAGNATTSSPVTVTVSNGTDTTQPTVLETTPAGGAADVTLNSPVTVTFSEAMDAASISGTAVVQSALELQDSEGVSVAASVTYDAASFTATLTPSTSLATSTTYTMTVRGGMTDPRAKDLAGLALAQSYTSSFTTTDTDACGANPIVAENCLTGNPESEWDVSGIGDESIQGFATDISVNRGNTVDFKVDTDASDWHLDIYRMGYYDGMGARKVATVDGTGAQSQLDCLTDDSTGLMDCGNWSVSTSWTVPDTATSGIYFAKAVRTDTGGASHILFIVRDDASQSDILFQTSDTTWQTYTEYFGNSLYYGSGPGGGDAANGRAYKVSYNRPFFTRESPPVGETETWVFNAEYPMVRWLEANGYDVTYFTGVDADRNGGLIKNHKVWMSNGHDEYWSGGERTNVEAARDAGVHLAFFSGNTIFWKTRWENAIDGSGTPYRTLVCYKETHENAVIDPADPPTWTGTWRDPRFSPPADGGQPENALLGSIFYFNGSYPDPIMVPAEDGKMRFWRDTSVASLGAGQTATLAPGTLGAELNLDVDNGFRPAGLFGVSTTPVSTSDQYLLDYGSTYGAGSGTHRVTLYKAPSGALVFATGTYQWSWGLDAHHDRDDLGDTTDPAMQQATVNLFADMGVQPATLQSELTAATPSSDTAVPSSEITSPTANDTVSPGDPFTVSGTATDTGGGVVGGVEVSVDGGSTWHPATGRDTWSYTWLPETLGSVTIRSQAVDDSGNLETPEAGVTVTVATAPLQSIAVTPETPEILTGATQQFTATETYSDSSTQDLTSQVTWASSSTTVATIDPSGLATGASAGSTTVSATLDGVSGNTLLTVQDAPLTIATASLPDATVDTAYSATLAATGGTPPYHWTVTGGSLPDGLSLSDVGNISGTPTTTGSFGFTVQVSDTASPAATVSQALSIEVVTAPTTVTIWPSTAGPNLVDADADDPVELGVKFQSDVAGTITGIRFYKASTNTGTHVGNLWSSTGENLATVTFKGETASGWQQILFSNPVAIDADTVYVASYHTNGGHYSDDESYFAVNGVDNPPLHALADGISGGNGDYAYGSSSAFPTQTWNTSNYWVDVVLSPAEP